MAEMNRKLAATFCNLPFTLLAVLGIFIYHALIAIESIFVWVTPINRSSARTHFLDQSMSEPTCSCSGRKQIQCQVSDELFAPNNPISTPNLELVKVDAEQLGLCTSRVGSYSALSTPKVYPRSSMIPPDELSKEAEDFITCFRRRMRRESKMITEEKNMEFRQRMERGAL